MASILESQHMAPPATPEAYYRERCDHFGRLRETYNRLSYRNANISLALIAAGLACLAIGLWRRDGAWLVLAALLGGGFVVSFVLHGRVDRMHQRYDLLWQINNEGLLRLRRDWAALPLRQPPAPATHPYAADLDLLGHASLQQLLGTVYTPVGQATLQAWLLQPAAPAVVHARQGAVAELAPLATLRDDLALRARLLAETQAHYERFLRWAEEPGWLDRRSWLLALTWLLRLAMLALMLLQLAGLIASPLWLLLGAVHLLLFLIFARPINRIIQDVEVRQGIFRAYAELFNRITTEQLTAPVLRQIQATLSAEGLRADQHMERLQSTMVLAALRRHMFFFPVQVITLWDFHLLWLLERWKRAAGDHVRSWLVALGELEALLALATLKHDHPAWVFPEIAEDGPAVLRARDLGHPLLPPTACVGNDVEIGPPGSFLLVTGSNMSGKSTLLRAIGVNVTLAQMGGPVCATSFSTPPLVLATSMRVQDSLEQGVSFFMAELRQLKQVVDAAHRLSAAGEWTLLYLLDEILHGTNTSERQIAARGILRHLLAQPAIGAISTHDLTLADSPDLMRSSRPIHFTETFTNEPTGPVMTFDYRARPGIATSTNALKLMAMVGLPIDSLLSPTVEC